REWRTMMFCPHCGAESTSELNYCKRCGGNLYALAPGQQAETRPAVSAGVAWAIGGTTLFLVLCGLIGMLAALTDMARGRDFLTPIVFIAVAGGATILGSVALLMRFWTNLLIGAQKTNKPATFAKPSKTNDLGPARVSALPEPIPSSVTEHTTRTFDPAYRGSKR
ncbi:MAG: hypothetical protein WCD76_07295, partial [Pyrinomonadaceae bacterium]